MTDANGNEMHEAIIQELNKLSITDAEIENNEEEEACFSDEDYGSDEIPQSMLSYFETSKNRTAEREKLILEDLKDFTVAPESCSNCSENILRDLALDFEEDPKMLRDEERVISEIECSYTSTEPSRLSAPADTKAYLAHNVSVCLDNEAEIEGDKYQEHEKRLQLELLALERTLKEEEERRATEYQLEREERQREQREKEDQWRLMERDFEEERRRVEEAEEKALQMMEKEIEEELPQELLLHQELISNLQRQLEQERRAFEEAQEEERRRREALCQGAATTIQAAVRGHLVRCRSRAELSHRREERRRCEEQLRRRRELEERRRREQEEETKRREEEAREQERRRAEYERATEEERARLERERKLEEERKEEEEEERKKKEEEERKKKEEEERRKREEERRKREEELKKREDEVKRIREEEERRVEEEGRRKREEEEKSKREEEDRRSKEEEQKKRKEEERRKREEERQREERRKREEEERRKREEQKERRKREEEENRKRDEEPRIREEEERWEKTDDTKREESERERRVNEPQKKENEKECLKALREKRTADNRRDSTQTYCPPRQTYCPPCTFQLKTNTSQTPSSRSPSHNMSTVNLTNTKIIESTVEQSGLKMENIGHNSKMVDKVDPIVNTSTIHPVAFDTVSQICLPEDTEQKRLAWMRDCVPWSKLSLQNKRKQGRTPTQGRRGARRAAGAGGLPPLSPDALLRSGGWKSLEEVTTVTLGDLPGCSLSMLARCPRLQSLTLRRCGLKALEGLSHCPELCYIDVQENDITFVDCENLTNLRVLRLGRNRLTSVHGLGGAVNLDVLELSHNSITRIAGLESMKRLQSLSVDHNQLISTRGLREVCTLLHLDCSYNHLTSVEGLDSCALLSTLDLRANSLTEPPSLSNQVLLRELHLDDNSVPSLDLLADCWLPLLQTLSGAQNSITQLSPMSDFVSLVNLDLRHNCLSEPGNVCDSLGGCLLLRELHLTGNPLQQDSSWRSTLLEAVPGLRAIDCQETNLSASPPAVHHSTLPADSFLAFCQAQLQQRQALQQQHSRELSGVTSPLDALKISCRHHTEALQLAEDHRYAHEYGDATVTDKGGDTAHTVPDQSLHTDGTDHKRIIERPEMESPGNGSQKVPAPRSTGDNGKDWTFEEMTGAERQSGSPENVALKPTLELSFSHAIASNSSSNSPSGMKNPSPSESREEPIPDLQKPDARNRAAVVIQQLWRRHRQTRERTRCPPTAHKGGGGGGGGGKRARAGLGPTHVERSALDPDYAATVIQAFWRGYALRTRLALALASAAAACSDAGEDGFEEVDVEEFVFDETALESDWMPLLSEDSAPRTLSVSDRPSCSKHPGFFPQPSQHRPPPLPIWRPRQAWVAGEQMEPPGQKVSPESTNRTKSPASTTMLSGLSERSEKILEEWGFSDSHTAFLMLKRAQKMKSKKLRQMKHMDPSVHLALFRNYTNQLAPVEARKRPSPEKRDYSIVGEASLGLQQAGRAQQMRLQQERTSQWLHSQAGHSDRHSESDHFLPEIDPDILNGGRVQLVAIPGYRESPDLALGLRGNGTSIPPSHKEYNHHPRGNSRGHAKNEVPSPTRVTSTPSKKDRISFRDNPVQRSGGWGGGKKREKVRK